MLYRFVIGPILADAGCRIQYSIVEVAPEVLFASVYLCWIVFVVRAAHCPCPRGCWQVCLLLAPLTERIVPILLTLAAVIAGGIAGSSGGTSDTFGHFRQSVQLAFFFIYATSTVLLVAVGWSTCSAIDHFVDESLFQDGRRGTLYQRAREMMTRSSRAGTSRSSSDRARAAASRGSGPATSSGGWKATALLGSSPADLTATADPESGGRPAAALVRQPGAGAAPTGRGRIPSFAGLAGLLNGEEMPGVPRLRASSSGRNRLYHSGDIGGMPFSPGLSDAFQLRTGAMAEAPLIRHLRQVSAPSDREVSMQLLQMPDGKKAGLGLEGLALGMLSASDDSSVGKSAGRRSSAHSAVRDVMPLDGAEAAEAAVEVAGAATPWEGSSENLVGEALVGTRSAGTSVRRAGAGGSTGLRRHVSLDEIDYGRVRLGDSAARLPQHAGAASALPAELSPHSSLVSEGSSGDDDGLTAQLMGGVAVAMPTPEFVSGRWVQSSGGSSRVTAARAEASAEAAAAGAGEAGAGDGGAAELVLTQSQRLQLRDTVTVMWIMCVSLTVILTLRCIWAALICFGAFAAVNGVPSWAEAYASVYDAVFFLLVELVPAAVVLRVQVTRESPHAVDAEMEESNGNDEHLTAATETGLRRASGLAGDRLIAPGVVKRASQYGSLEETTQAAEADLHSVLSGDSSNHHRFDPQGQQPFNGVHTFMLPHQPLAAAVRSAAPSAPSGSLVLHGDDGSFVRGSLPSELSDGGSFDESVYDDAADGRVPGAMSSEAVDSMGFGRDGTEGEDDDYF